LEDNEWLYVAPQPGVLTVLCSKQEPSDIEIAGAGNLKLHSACKAHGSRILIQAHTIKTSNNTEKDIIPPLSLEYDCRVSEGRTTKLNKIQLELPLKSIVNRLEDLRLASHKVEEVDRLISEQEWKLKKSNFYFHLSSLSYVGMVTSSLVMIAFCYCCCCCNVVRECFRTFPNGGRTTILLPP
jgi:hypothetical protein